MLPGFLASLACSFSLAGVGFSLLLGFGLIWLLDLPAACPALASVLGILSTGTRGTREGHSVLPREAEEPEEAQTLSLRFTSCLCSIFISSLPLRVFQRQVFFPALPLLASAPTQFNPSHLPIMPEFVLSVDIGTTSTRAIVGLAYLDGATASSSRLTLSFSRSQVFNEAAEALCTSQLEYDQIYPHPVRVLSLVFRCLRSCLRSRSSPGMA